MERLRTLTFSGNEEGIKIIGEKWKVANADVGLLDICWCCGANHIGKIQKEQARCARYQVLPGGDDWWYKLGATKS